ncbi:3-dehydroquinate synthase [Candidatus Neomarinimicrobiota bacterium]
METISVNLESRSYDIFVERGLMSKLPGLLKKWNVGQKWAIISQTTLMNKFGNELLESLQDAGFDVNLIPVPVGEKAKTLHQIELIFETLLEMKYDRSSILIGLGGGVVGDITGFVAATYMRGISYIQIPTTLLAMVDSSIGGKTGVNLQSVKNSVGAIYQPLSVFSDPNLLVLLPRREIVSGLAEIIKYGAIKDKKFFQKLSNQLNNIIAFEDLELLEKVISRACEIKVEIVEQDEHDHEIRRILNFGHTVGHALEAFFGYEELRHGEAVAYGILSAGHISNAKGLLSDNDWSLLKSTINNLPLPILPTLNPDGILNIIRNDKKIRAGSLHFILLKKLGEAVISDTISEQDIRSALEVL